MTDMPEPKPPRTDAIQPHPTEPVVLETVPDAIEPIQARESRYCLRCHRRLREYRLMPGEQPRCPECRLPYNPFDRTTYDRLPPVRRWKFWLSVLLLTILYGIVTYGCIFAMDQKGPLEQFGMALFLFVPFSVGALLGFLIRPGIGLAVLFSILAGISIAALTIPMAIHGYFCGLTLGIFFAVPALVGAVSGWLIRILLANAAWDGRRHFISLGLAALPFVANLAEHHLFPQEVVIAEVRTGSVFPATRRAAWDSIVFYEQVEHEPPWLLKLSLPRPVRAEGSKSKVGDVERCIYVRGHLVKEITECVAGERLAFRVTEQCLDCEACFEHDVKLLDGAFLLEPLDDGQTRVVLTTRYQRRLRPAWMWEWVERKVAHTLHGHVLEGMRRRLPAPEGPYPEALPPVAQHR